MGEMVEKVARALAGASGDLAWEHRKVWERAAYMAQARAAIAAMREATPMMANAATHRETDDGGYVSVNDVHGIWEDMIDAALAERERVEG